jgi:HEAT repeat protein
MFLLCGLCVSTVKPGFAGQAEPPPDPGFEISVRAADVIAEVEILAGGPFRAAAQVRKTIKGSAPEVVELEGYNSYQWDAVHRGFATGSRHILFLSRTERPDVFATLTPAAPRLSVQTEGVFLSLGDPPFRVPIAKAVMYEALGLLVEAGETGKAPETAAAFVRNQWDAGEIELRYLAVALAGALRDERLTPLVIEASKDKLLKLRQTAVDALGKIGSPDALMALRALLKDEKATIARDAARALVARRDLVSLSELLVWAKKNAAAAPVGRAPAPAADSSRAKADAVIADVLRLAADAGPLLDPEPLVPPLVQLVRSPNETIAAAALSALVAIAQPPHVPQLLDLGEELSFDGRARVVAALQRITLAPCREMETFRAWWAQWGKGFGEDIKRDFVEAAVKALAQADSYEERRRAVETIRSAPGAISLVSAAAMLMKDESIFGASDIAAWDSPLAVPFLLERLGRDSQTERRDAFDGLVRLCAEHPRLRSALWPLISSQLAEDDGTCRRQAQAACGRFGRADGVLALLDAIEYAGGSEAQEATKSLYALTARTLGFSVFEPIPDEDIARAHLRGWWRTVQKPFRPVLEAARTTANPPDAESLVLARDSRRAAAAFAAAFAERPAGDSLWKKVASQGRQRDRAHGLLGLLGGDAALAPQLMRAALASGQDAEPLLCRALALVSLASLAKGGEGKLVPLTEYSTWLRGLKADAAPWRRLGIVALGLADGEPQSLAVLDELVKTALAAQPAENDTTGFGGGVAANEDYALLTPTLVALCARGDGTPLLLKLLEQTTDARVREIAARSISLRRESLLSRPAAVASLAKALGKCTRYGWLDLCRAADPLLTPPDAPAILALLEHESVATRSATAYILSERPDLAPDAAALKPLLAGLADTAPVVRYYCARALGKRLSPVARLTAAGIAAIRTDVLRKLVELLRDDDEEVRAAAAEAIGTIGDPEACVAAAAAAEDEARMRLRLDRKWLRAMAIGGGEVHTAFLIKLCGSSAYNDQRAGYEALAVASDPATLALLLKTFRSDESSFQTVAADSLAERALRDAARPANGREVSSVITALDEDLKSGDKTVRARAIHLLARVDTPASRAALKQVQAGEDAAARALADFALKRLAKPAGGEGQGTR